MPTSRKKPIRPVSRELVLKAKDDDPPVAIFDQNGKLLGIVDPKDITPVATPAESGAAPAAKKAPTGSQRAEAAAGEDPQMGVAKARAAALELKKGLYNGATVADRERLAEAMNAAAIRVERQIHGQRRWI